MMIGHVSPWSGKTVERLVILSTFLNLEPYISHYRREHAPQRLYVDPSVTNLSPKLCHEEYESCLSHKHHTYSAAVTDAEGI